MKHLLKVAKTYCLLKAKVEAASKLTLIDDANDLSYLLGNLKDLEKFDLKGSLRMRGEPRLTQTVQRCEEHIAIFQKAMALEYFQIVNLEVELLYT